MDAKNVHWTGHGEFGAGRCFVVHQVSLCLDFFVPVIQQAVRGLLDGEQ